MRLYFCGVSQLALAKSFARYDVLQVSKCGCDLIEQERRRKQESSGRQTTSFRAEGQKEGLFRTCFNGFHTTEGRRRRRRREFAGMGGRLQLPDIQL